MRFQWRCHTATCPRHRTSDGPIGGRRIRVLIVDDQALFAEALESTLRSHGFDIVGVVSRGRQAIEIAGRVRPELVLLDLGLPDMDGLDVGRELLAGSPNIRVIALTGREDPGVIREALDAGFHAFVSKGSPLSDLMGVIVASVEGSVLLPEVELDEGGAPETAGEQLLLNQLTARERQILTLLTEGLSTAGIAERLVVSRNTVRTHVQNIRSKLQVHTRLEAAAFARRHGISLAS